MVELLQAAAVTPTPVFDRLAGEVEIHELHPQEAAIVRVDVPLAELPAAIGQALREVHEQMVAAGVEIAGPPFTRYPAIQPTGITAECGFPVMRPAPAVGRVEPARLSGGRAASIIHLGRYDTLDQTYDRLQASLARSGLRASGPMWEVYWTDPDMEPDESRWRTEIIIPIDHPDD